MALKLVAIGCMHGNLKKSVLDMIKSEKPDAVLISGDFSGGDFADDLRKYEKKLVDDFGPVSELWPLRVQIDSEKKFRKWGKTSAENTARVFQSLKRLDVPIHYIYGNWDSVSMGMKRAFEGSGEFCVDDAEGGNMKFIHDKIVRVGDFEVIGFGGYRGTSTKEYLYKDLPEPRPDMSYIAHIRDNITKRMERLFQRAKDPRKTILLTHDPPYKFFDYLASAKKNYGEKITRQELEKHAPILCICSHFHEHQGRAKLKTTTVVNSGYGHDGECALIEIDGEVKVKLMKL